MTTYKTPGIYVSEVSSLRETIHPSGGLTPLFIGYTETGGGRRAYMEAGVCLLLSMAAYSDEGDHPDRGIVITQIGAS